MTEKQPTYSALRRRCERLEAALNKALKDGARDRQSYYDLLAEKIDWEMRAKQAARILSGEDA